MLAPLVRLIRHRFARDSRRLVSDAALQNLAALVAASERQHSGEIRICIESRLPHSYLLRPDAIQAITRERAVAQFGKLRVWDTEHNNGVLIYLQLAERAIEIVADRGLASHVTPAMWQAIVQKLGDALQSGQFESGLRQAIAEVSALLSEHFPQYPGAENPNELPDLPSRR